MLSNQRFPSGSGLRATENLDATLAFVTGTPDPRDEWADALALRTADLERRSTIRCDRLSRIRPVAEAIPRSHAERVINPGRALPSVFEAWGDVLATCSEGPSGQVARARNTPQPRGL